MSRTNIHKNANIHENATPGSVLLALKDLGLDTDEQGSFFLAHQEEIDKGIRNASATYFVVSKALQAHDGPVVTRTGPELDDVMSSWEDDSELEDDQE